MKTLASVLAVCVLASFASANLISDSTCDAELVYYDKNGGTTAGAIDADVWYSAGRPGEPTYWGRGWDEVEEDGNQYYAHNAYDSGGRALIQKITMPAAGDYTLQFDINATAVPVDVNEWNIRGIADAGEINARMEHYDGGGGTDENDLVQIPYGDLVTDTSGEWITRTIPFTITADMASNPWLLLVFTAENDDADTPFIDNVSITPEPASMSVLGLGALALIRRRR